jgi:putative colanic acid biosynthesis glycosyltransferase WcaI
VTLYLVTQHYAPDTTSTAAFMTGVAEELACENDVVVLSGSEGSANGSGAGRPRVIEIRNGAAPKAALKGRGLAMAAFGLRIFAGLVRRLRRGDIVLVVTTPFALPFFAVLAARLRRAQPVLIVYDLYPDVLAAAGLVGERSFAARALRFANGPMLRALAAIVVVGRDMEVPLLRYRGIAREMIAVVPNWATLAPGVRPIRGDNPFRRAMPARFVAGLFGNVGFTHDPETVFAAARRLAGEPDIHLLLSGTGVGWDRLNALQQAARLPNVTLVERVPDAQLEDFLAAADVWILPYRKNAARLSVPSRLYNLLAVGRPAIALSEADAEYARMIADDDIGWVVPPGDADALAETIRAAAREPEAVAAKGERAASIAARYSRRAAADHYRALVRRLRSGAESR